MIDQALVNLRPGSRWEMIGETYEDIIWHDQANAIPSKLEVNAEVIRLTKEYWATRYQRQRAPEYPPIAEQLDALWKGGGAAAEMLARVQAVKAKYPKPTGT
jgi:hypothetical protein